MLSRRTLLKSAAAFAIPVMAAESEWGGPVIDIHLHPRPTPPENLAHVEGCGATAAVLLTNYAAEAQAKATMDTYPGRFYRFISIDVTRPDAVELFTKAVKGGAIGFGELKYHVACDGPEMNRMYDLAAELNVPLTMHFQEVSQAAAAGKFNYNFERLPAMLKAHPKTKFIGHADYFWANISAEVKPDVAYPKGPVKRGGLTDKMLSDYPNLYADLSANSCRNALARDLDFSRDFLARHQDKIMFGSDCSCRDGHGAGQRSQEPLIAGKCVARETLTALKQLCSPEVFRKATWDNAHRVLRLS